MPEDDAVRNRLLAFIAGMIAIVGLRMSYAVTMPLAVAIVIIAAIWPVKPWLDRALPSSLSYLGTVLVLLRRADGVRERGVFLDRQIVQAFSAHWSEFQQIYEAITGWAARHGLPLGGATGYARLVGMGQSLLARHLYGVRLSRVHRPSGDPGLTQAPALRRKIENRLDTTDRRELLDAIDLIGGKIRQYPGVTTLMGLLPGRRRRFGRCLWALTSRSSGAC